VAPSIDVIRGVCMVANLEDVLIKIVVLMHSS